MNSKILSNTADKRRANNIELLRVVAMLLVITTHFWGHGIDLASIEPFTFAYYFGWLMKGASYVCINTYVLISAYFLCKSEFKIKRILNLWTEVEFYSIVLYVLSIVTGGQNINLKSLLSALLPVVSSEYWFVTIYIGMFLLSPVLNFMIGSMNQRQHGVSILILSILFVVVPNIFFYSKWLNFGTGYGIVWFTVLYFIGAYVRLYITKEWTEKHKAKIRIITTISLILPFVSRVVIAAGTKIILGHVIGAGLFYSNNSILIVPASVLLLLSFLSINISSIRISAIITFFAKGSFAVYLIHDNPNISDKMWKLLTAHININSPTLVFYFILIVLGIYLACACVDCFRRLLFKPIEQFPIGKKADEFINNCFHVE